MSPRRPKMTAQNEPQEGQSELREASGSDLGRISEAFTSNAMRPRRSQLKSPARARSARARLQAGAAARIFSQPSPGSSQTALEKRTRNSRNAPAPNARRARAAREQGLHATHHTRNLDARVALATLASLCLVVLCSGSSRRSLCFSPRVFRRCAQHVFAAFPWIEPESSEPKRSKLTKRSSSKRPASARSARARAARDPPHSQS